MPMTSQGGRDSKAKGRRGPPLPVLVLMVAAIAGLAGVAWSQRELLSPGEQGLLVEAQLETDPIRRQVISAANVRWRFQPDGAFGPEIVADIAVPERRQNISLAFRKNTDDELPASYIIEVVSGPTYPGRRIAAIPAVSAKQTYRSEGSRLIGAAVTVAEDRFWYALSAERFDVNANRNLLRAAEIFELALTYDTGRPALLLVDKGASGTRVFEEAAALWGD
jgi:hypothetical protein